MTDALVVDLDLPPSERWSSLDAVADDARLMLDGYTRSLGGLGDFDGLLERFADQCLPQELRAEIDAIAGIVDKPVSKVLAANLFYDVLGYALACTAFAVDTPRGPLHARNFDWRSPRNVLGRFTQAIHYCRGGKLRFLTIAWPGFIGAFSGFAPGRFSITLNGVRSAEPNRLATPMLLLVREVLDRAESYEDAVNTLRTATVASSSLVMVAGVEPGQMCVVERTPTQSVVRRPENGFLVMTNAYQALGSVELSNLAEPQTPDCKRRNETAARLLAGRRPASVEDAFVVLNHEGVRDRKTSQQMVFFDGMVDLVVRARASATG